MTGYEKYFHGRCLLPKNMTTAKWEQEVFPTLEKLEKFMDPGVLSSGNFRVVGPILTWDEVYKDIIRWCRKEVPIDYYRNEIRYHEHSPVLDACKIAGIGMVQFWAGKFGKGLELRWLFGPRDQDVRREKNRIRKLQKMLSQLFPEGVKIRHYSWEEYHELYPRDSQEKYENAYGR